MFTRRYKIVICICVFVLWGIIPILALLTNNGYRVSNSLKVDKSTTPIYGGSRKIGLDDNGTIYFIDKYLFFNDIKSVKGNKVKHLMYVNKYAQIEVSGRQLYCLEEEDVLFEYNLDSKKKKIISNNCWNFRIVNNVLFYQEYIDDSYVFYCKKEGECKTVITHKYVIWYSEYNGNVIFLTEGKTKNLCEYNILKNEIDEIGEFVIKNRPTMITVHNDLLLANFFNTISIYDIKLKKQYELPREEYFSTVAFISNGKNIVYSIQRHSNEGSFVYNIKSDVNGTWLLNLDNGESTLITKTVFENLYFFGDALVGEKYSKFYRISLDGDVQRIFAP